MSLSYREHDVLRAAAVGLTTKQTAAKLDISHYTVEGHRKNILAALNANNMCHAVAIGFREGILR